MNESILIERLVMVSPFLKERSRIKQWDESPACPSEYPTQYIRRKKWMPPLKKINILVAI